MQRTITDDMRADMRRSVERYIPNPTDDLLDSLIREAWREQDWEARHS